MRHRKKGEKREKNSMTSTTARVRKEMRRWRKSNVIEAAATCYHKNIRLKTPSLVEESVDLRICLHSTCEFDPTDLDCANRIKKKN